MNQTITDFIVEYSREIEANNAAIFAGAGLSASAGFVNWKALLAPVAKEIGLDVDREEDLVSLAQYHVNENGNNRGHLNKILIENFSQKNHVTENHKILARLPIRTYWTTNYDKLIESALEQNGKVVDVKFTVNQLAVTVPNRDSIVYKMHGDVQHSDQAVLTKDDYEAYHIKMAPFNTALSGDLVSKTFLFLGFSFSDPHLNYVLSRIRASHTQHQRRHYCIFKKDSRKPNEKNSDFTYRCAKQTLFIKDLLRFNIRTLLINDYQEITEILNLIESKYRQRSIFVGGSAQDYGIWGREATENFLQEFSRKLIEMNFRIISGFGLGVGGPLISGALQTIYFNKKHYTEAQLQIRPFPQNESKKINRRELWEHYRQDMISHAGIAVFLFGNKTLDGKIVEADGLEREFRIAVERGCVVIPVGATGYTSEKLFKEVSGNFSVFFGKRSREFKNQFMELGNKKNSPEIILNKLISVISDLYKS